MPINWANPSGFAGVSWDLNSDSFTVGLATYTPLAELSSFAPDSPARYHEIDQQFMLLQQTAAAAYKLSGRFFIGAAFNIAEGWLSWRFQRDSAIYGGSAATDAANGPCGAQPCGFENPAAAQRVQLRGFGWGFGFSVGVLGRPIDRLWLAAAYTSHIFNTGLGTDLPMHDQTNARVTPAPSQGTVCGVLANGQPGACGGGDLVTLSVPDLIHIGMRIEINPRIDVESWARWIHYGIRPAIDVQLQGGTLGALSTSRGAAIAPQQLYDRGLQDAFGFEASGRFKLGALRLAPSVFYETPAIDMSAENPAALDGHKIDVALAAEWRPAAHLVFGARAGLTSHVIGGVRSRYSPRATVACVDADFSLDACRAAAAGSALPSASGNYLLFVVHLSAAVGIEY